VKSILEGKIRNKPHQTNDGWGVEGNVSFLMNKIQDFCNGKGWNQKEQEKWGGSLDERGRFNEPTGKKQGGQP